MVMIQNFQTVSILLNPIEQAQKKLKTHFESGTSSNLSIFEAANLLDTIVFSKENVNNIFTNFTINAN